MNMGHGTTEENKDKRLETREGDEEWTKSIMK